MIFPGMDPYLEKPSLWQGFHNPLLTYIRELLQPLLRPRYVAAVESRVFVTGFDRLVTPDVWVRRRKRDAGAAGVAVLEPDTPDILVVSEQTTQQPYLEILDRESGMEVVTVVEAISPSNKFAGPGRDAYLQKQREVIASRANLVEIDLLRTGPHVAAVPEHEVRMRYAYDYLVSVSRASAGRQKYELYPRRLNQPLPRIKVPLADADPDVTLDLQAAVTKAYETGAYEDVIEYAEPCDPTLSPADQEWANALIRAALGGPPERPSPTPGTAGA